MLFDDSIRFLGNYRPYQQRALDQIERFLDNQKIHIVAAPGSGKTILGLEIIRRLDQVTLVLVPTITIREQWIERFSHGFLQNEEEKEKWISNDLLHFKPITCITYQALYSAYKNVIPTTVDEDDEEIEEEEKYDYKDLDLLSILKDRKVQTICLDECHHLKSEWWRALENTIKQLEDIRIVALTATPPYDSSYQEWQRYIDLCGPIDEEIFVPELIKDHNLCPHQDFVYFSFPTQAEEKAIMKYYANGIKIYNKYKNNQELLKIIKQNQIFQNHKQFSKHYYVNAPYYRALVIYLEENHISVPRLVHLLARVEPLTICHFETLLQHMLFDDAASYPNDPLLMKMKKEFAALGVVNKRKINLHHDERIDKILGRSTSKLKSICEIVRFESASQNNKMKCLILTDYIKRKSKSWIATDKEIDTIGTIPVFEALRRENIRNVTLCLLSGAICIVPKNCVSHLNEFIEEEKKFESNDISGTIYTEIMVKTNNRKKLVSTITSLFQEGYFNVVVGTKSLLGEGWDSPCINTLIMASVVGSYVLSNQSRGRAIRTDKENIDKVSNVWHLACLDPYDSKYSNDYYVLKRRFSTFVGVDAKHKVIEDGLDRINISFPPRNHFEADAVNNEMIRNSINRNKTRALWKSSIEEAKQIEVLTKITYIQKKRLNRSYSFYASLVASLLWFSLYFIFFQSYIDFVNQSSYDVVAMVVFLLLISVVSYFFSHFLMRLIRQLTPALKLKALGIAVLNALRQGSVIQAKTAGVVILKEGFDQLAIYLENATTYEQNIFSECIKQMLSEIDQPRYLIAHPKSFLLQEFYIVPDVFKKNKDTVIIFKKQIDRQFGTFHPIFAKNEHGKAAVVRARYLYFAHYNDTTIGEKRVLLKKNKKILLDKKSLFKKNL